MAIITGSVVYLKSDRSRSFRMTVTKKTEHDGDRFCTCVWPKDGEIAEKVFNEKCLAEVGEEDQKMGL